ncbi:MAG: hypothetical protein E6J74_22645 [Deltaproteobacteria bacterium]|nr:MAG: hypothetical protein E6J74_22645 [Deltaproteobacteria bacterium]
MRRRGGRRKAEKRSRRGFCDGHTLDWGNEDKLLDGCPQLLAYMKQMYARPHAPARIAEAFAAISSEQNSARGIDG